jgi:hypothetical protein
MLIDDISQVKRLMMSRLPMGRDRVASFLDVDILRSRFDIRHLRFDDHCSRKSALTQVQGKVIVSVILQI